MTVVTAVIGIPWGLIAGFIGGPADSLLMRFADIQLSIPSLVLYLTILIVLGPGLRNMILSLGIASWVTFARVTRSEVLAIRNTQFVEAARSVGQREPRIIFVHVLPNVMNSVIVLSTLVVGTLILEAAALSFLGLGIPPSIPAWGSMVADGRAYIQVAWWISTIPGIAIFIAVLGFNLFGDWLRDYLDPRLRGV
jgi:peptide/nickel transport system permease protein